MKPLKEICRGLSRNDDDYLFLTSLCDKMLACESRNVLASTRFLDAHKLSLAQSFLQRAGSGNHLFDGGSECAERKICVFLPDYPAAHDQLRFIRAHKARQDTLSHRDYLGSLMGLQISRDVIGDIFVHEDGADIVVLASALDYIMLEYQKAGRKTLSLSVITREMLRESSDTAMIMRATVSSLRFDAVVSAAFHLPRAVSAGLITQGKALLNAAECLNADKALSENDVITIRGKGRAVITDILGTSKKGRTIIQLIIKN